MVLKQDMMDYSVSSILSKLMHLSLSYGLEIHALGVVSRLSCSRSMPRFFVASWLIFWMIVFVLGVYTTYGGGIFNFFHPAADWNGALRVENGMNGISRKLDRMSPCRHTSGLGFLTIQGHTLFQGCELGCAMLY